MNKIIRIIIYAQLLLILSYSTSCNDLTYNPKDENYVNVPQPSINTKNIIINVDNIDPNDTTLLTGFVSFKYSLDIDNKPVKNVYLYLDSTLINNSYGGEASFESSSYPDGLHTIKMIIEVSAANGSLSDKLGLEGFIVTKIFTVYIENTPSPPLNIISAVPENGKLKLTWQKCAKRAFVSYEIFMGNNSDTIKDVNQNYTYANNFVGGIMDFHVNITTAVGTTNGGIFLDTGAVTEINKIITLDNYKVEIEWDSCKYYANVKSYSIYRMIDNNMNTNQRVATITNPIGNTYIDGPLYFGAKIEYTLLTIPIEGYYSTISTQKSFYIGSKLQYSGFIKYLKSTSSFYISDNSSILRLDGTNLNTIASNSNAGNYDFANDGSDGFAVDADHNSTAIWELNPLTLQRGKAYYTEDYVGYKSIPMIICYMPPDKIVYEGFREVRPNQFYSDKMFLINLSTKQTATLGDSLYNFPLLLQHTNNGKYIEVDKGNNLEIYDVSQNSFRLTYSTPSSVEGVYAGTFCFDQTGNNFITTVNNTIIIRRCSDGTIIQQIPVQDPLVSPIIDPATGYLGGTVSQKNVYRIYDLQSGTLKKEIPAMGYDFTFQNSILFENGYYLRLIY